jgi:hypothetical protein
LPHARACVTCSRRHLTRHRRRITAGVYLLRHWQLNQQDKYWRMLRQLLIQAQQLNDDALLDNPYLTVAHMINVEGH